jgi:hypothetical protein
MQPYVFATWRKIGRSAKGTFSMTQIHTFIRAAILGAALGFPAAVGAASLSPLDGLVSGTAVPDLDRVPGLPDAPAVASDLGAPRPTAPPTFKFVDDTGLNADPLRGILPESQWANPQAAQNGLVRRR